MINREELITILKEELNLEVSVTREHASMGDGHWQTIRVQLVTNDGTVVLSAEDYISES